MIGPASASITELFSHATAVDRASNGKPRLLIVDDVADNRIILARRFQRQNFEIVEAESGSRALTLIAGEKFDVVLLDVTMPDMNGFDVLKVIREKHTPSALPVIMVTANNLSADVVHALESGANDYVAKPVDFAIALARVHAQVERKRVNEALDSAYAALNQNNEELERRVADRTSELRTINQQLQREITNRELSEARSLYLAYHDALTGLGNRAIFREEVQRALKVSQLTREPLAVLFVDLDGFKGVNDTLGHSVGDALLKALAVRLRDNLPQEVVIARLGGDEFGIMLAPCKTLESATSLASRVVDLIGKPVRADNHDLNVSGSVGVALSGPRETTENLLKCADLAMYRAKSDGRSSDSPGAYRVFDPEMDTAAQAKVRLKNEMRLALLKEGFELYFQPIVSAETRMVTGFEALARWPHAEFGMIPPSEFIPMAESTGLIVQFGEWVLKTACKEAMKWPDQLTIAINLSPVQFARGRDLVNCVAEALAESGLPANRLELEITETVLLDKTERNVEILQNIRMLGARISMDDFGTGFSSLSYLRRFPFDKIKIDQSFIQTLSHDRRSQTIVSAIAGLGQSFGMATVAEGVETQDQLECLVMKGCTEIQGNYYSPPVPGSEVLKLLATIDAMQLPEPGSLAT